ncbi:alpha-amylase family protein [Pontibacter sp. SGAir0037]|uniref:alpha-amylase family protein n=1 Tax=Pontibacter sp. SGAir0037 TaxID=2571030 RepID=UPI0010CCEB42|nr:alpha-amylase family protein [Pontibacter sp. SGAir0037]QCR23875.1 trehalose synthase [Pontibacter sp. SGAir0037]
MIIEKDFWYKNTVWYALDVETFQDSNNDGIGDFRGLITRVDYLATLGINCIWLLPFYPSPNRDNGYDIMDYYNVDSRLGNLGDFAAFVQAAKERGIRVVVDLVINHTSSQHPWFLEARENKNSPYYQYYTWSKEKPENPEYEPAFSGEDNSIWQYDEVAGEYFLHRFYKHQPDLNLANPAVRREVHQIMGFWLSLGVAGFRVDAAHILVQNDNPQHQEEFYDLIEDMREFISNHSRDGVLLAEASGPPKAVGKFFKGKERVHMMFNFLLNQHMFLALATEEAKPLQKGLAILPEKDFTSQWLNFLRHHDELNLEDLKEEEQKHVFEAFAPSEDMLIFGRGIRRRLAPMLNGDQKRLELAYSLLFSMPGTPVIQYGSEIAMGDDLSLQGRNSVRTAMQWSPERNGGFSEAAPSKLPRPSIAQGDYAYTRVNVIRQQHDKNSMLNWMEHTIRLRRQYLEIGNGELEILKTNHKAVFAHTCRLHCFVLAVHNMSREEVSVTLPILEEEHESVLELMSDNGNYTLPKKGELKLNAYGYRWFYIRPSENAGTKAEKSSSSSKKQGKKK